MTREEQLEVLEKYQKALNPHEEGEDRKRAAQFVLSFYGRMQFASVETAMLGVLHQTLRKSAGHVMFIGRSEYFHDEHGELYCASIHDDHFDVCGYRQGARWECVPREDDHGKYLELRRRLYEEVLASVNSVHIANEMEAWRKEKELDMAIDS
jgi:hypothetical protein